MSHLVVGWLASRKARVTGVQSRNPDRRAHGCAPACSRALELAQADGSRIPSGFQVITRTVARPRLFGMVPPVANPQNLAMRELRPPLDLGEVDAVNDVSDHVFEQKGRDVVRIGPGVSRRASGERTAFVIAVSTACSTQSSSGGIVAASGTLLTAGRLQVTQLRRGGVPTYIVRFNMAVVENSSASGRRWYGPEHNMAAVRRLPGGRPPRFQG
jgi:hypothetical protein